MTVDGAKEWLNNETQAQEKMNSQCGSANNCCRRADDPWACCNGDEEAASSELSNVVFAAGKTAETSKVYVEHIPIEGIIRAKLEYDTELGIPTLQLDILNPTIALSCCGKNR